MRLEKNNSIYVASVKQYYSSIAEQAQYIYYSRPCLFLIAVLLRLKTSLMKKFFAEVSLSF